MKIKYLSLILVFVVGCTVIGFSSCKDDSAIGGNIMPNGDDIVIGVDTVSLHAKTFSMQDSIFAQTQYGMLGRYTDPLMGVVQSNYMCELYCPLDVKFKDKVKNGKMDSVFVNMIYSSVSGDTISPMGIAVYELNKPLKDNFFTNQNPSDYCDLDKYLGQSLFTLHSDNDGVGEVSTKLNTAFGQRFYDEWKTNPETFKDNESFNKFFHGFYVTRTLGTNSLFRVEYTDFSIYYTYTGRNKANTQDSDRVGVFSMTATPEIKQLNFVKNQIPEDVYSHSDTQTYIKSPAGLATELTIPLKQIAEDMDKKVDNSKKNTFVNIANFKLKGFTEEEAKDPSKFQRPSYILMVNKDSLTDFFQKRKLIDNQTKFLIQYDKDTNTYPIGNNMASIINFYLKKFKDKNISDIPDLNYTLLPVDVTMETTTGPDGQPQNVITGVFNSMEPSTAIFRTNPKNMKLGIAFSRYKQN